MKITILAGGSRGDIQPYVALGFGLKHAGHDVRLATFSAYADMIQSAGLTHFPVCGDIKQAISAAENMGAMQADNPLKVLLSFNKLKKMVAATQADYYAACTNADVIIYHPGVTLGYFAAQEMDIPSILATPFPMTPTRAFPSVIFYDKVPRIPILNLLTHRILEQIMWMGSKAAVKSFWRDRYGHTPQDFSSPFSKQISMRNPTIISCSKNIFPQPHDWLKHIHMTGYWTLKTRPGWNPQQGLSDFLASGTPPVYVGFGSVGKAPKAREVGENCIKALQGIGYRGILAGELKNYFSLENNLNNIFSLDQAPHDWLFPRMAAVVHHGGAGTTAAAFTAGIPQVIVPFSNDQFAWGKRVEELGVGRRVIFRKNMTSDYLAEVIAEVLKPDYIKNAKLLGEKIKAEDGVSAAVEIIENALSG